MCYASLVMLRGRCFCAISILPTPLPRAIREGPSTPKNPLSPIIPACPACPDLRGEHLLRRIHTRTPLSALFPLHPRNLPVSALFPLLTQKEGGGGYLFSLSDLPSSVPGVRPDPVGVSPVARRFCSALSFSPLATRSPAAASAEEGHSPLSPIIPAPLATAALRVVPAPICTTTSRIHVGAPTFSCAKSVCRASGAGNHYGHRTQRSRAGASFWRAYSASEEGLAGWFVPLLELNWASGEGSLRFFLLCPFDFQLSTFNLQPFFFPKSSYCRTYEPSSRKSNYSRTYAKQGGGVGYRNGNVPKICRRADIPIVAGERRQTQEPV